MIDNDRLSQLEVETLELHWLEVNLILTYKIFWGVIQIAMKDCISAN